MPKRRGTGTRRIEGAGKLSMTSYASCAVGGSSMLRSTAKVTRNILALTFFPGLSCLNALGQTSEAQWRLDHFSDRAHLFYAEESTDNFGPTDFSCKFGQDVVEVSVHLLDEKVSALFESIAKKASDIPLVKIGDDKDGTEVESLSFDEFRGWTLHFKTKADAFSGVARTGELRISLLTFTQSNLYPNGLKNVRQFMSGCLGNK